MKVMIFDSEQEAAQSAAEYIINFIKEKPKAVLGLATGSGLADAAAVKSINKNQS